MRDPADPNPSRIAGVTGVRGRVGAGAAAAVPSSTRDAICTFVNADLERPDTWYAHAPLEWSIVPVQQARPRVSLPVTMHPERQERIDCFLRRRAPPWWRGWKGQLDPEPGHVVELTPLGRRLVGLDTWP